MVLGQFGTNNFTFQLIYNTAFSRSEATLIWKITFYIFSISLPTLIFLFDLILLNLFVFIVILLGTDVIIDSFHSWLLFLFLLHLSYLDLTAHMVTVP